MNPKFKIGDQVVYLAHDGSPFIGLIERIEKLGVWCYWISTYNGWVSEDKIHLRRLGK